MSASHTTFFAGDLESQSSALPYRLLHDVLDNAASQDAECARTLCLVSRWTRNLAVPHLYRTVSLRGEDAIEMLKAPSVSLPDGSEVPPTYFTQNLWFAAGPSIYEKEHDEVIKFFTELASQFPSVANLTMQSDSFHFLLLASKALPLVASINLRLEVLPGNWKYDLLPFTHNTPYAENTLLKRITHLTIHDSDLISAINLSSYSRLTHLAVNFSPWKKEDLPAIARGLLSAPNVEMVVLMIPDEWEEVEVDGVAFKQFIQSYLPDTRVYVAPLVFASQEQWRSMAEGEEATIWEEAQGFSDDSGFTSWIQSIARSETEPSDFISGHYINISSLVEPVA